MHSKTIKLTKAPQSYWISSTPQTVYPSLDEDITVDVAIVGGGLVGISTAFLLMNEGLKVAIIEADRIGQGTTGHTTAKITSQHNLIYHYIKKQFGDELAFQYAEANQTSIHTIAGIVKENNIDCDFRWQPAYVFTQSDEYIQKISDEAKTASSLGIKAHYLEHIPLPFSIKAALRFDDQAQFHPRKYLLALAEKISQKGSHIFEQTRAIDIKEGNPNLVITKGGKKVAAEKVIISSHFPFYDGLGLYPARLQPERSYVLGIKIKDSFPEGMFINAENPTRSLRSQRYKDDDLVLVSGEHQKTGEGKNLINHYENLKQFALSTFETDEILYRWSTQDYTTLDKVPYIGHLTSNTPNLFVATGFGKWGMTTSTVSAMIFRDLIIKGESPWQDVYNPSRFNFKASVGQFFKQNVGVAANFLSGKLLPLPSNVDINLGEGKVVEIHNKRVGAYRDEKNKLHLIDTTCTHMGCELNWNDAEKTWDCPCHGSRFTYDGDIVEGPAHHQLNHHEQGANEIDPNIL
jgi:glycine/D-amino acid oxidase-like deaminating enzyme/nitrite reductase/ring-hydroxylating ferredoxin subunit